MSGQAPLDDAAQRRIVRELLRKVIAKDVRVERRTSRSKYRPRRGRPAWKTDPNRILGQGEPRR